MKNLGRLVVFSLLAVLILLPAMSFVNYIPSKPAIVEGSPLPWPNPPVVNNMAVLTAEGSPLPWPNPPAVNNNAVLTAEGSPLPWPNPPMVSLVA